MDNKNIQVEKNLEDVILSASQSDLYKLIKNILDNSIAYNNDFGKIIITLNKDKLIISDTGIGISNEDQEFIFNRCEQGQNRKFTNISSSGIGLTLVKYLVELHNGEIRLESEVGKGSRFIISLPTS